MATRTETLRLVIDGEEVKNSYTDLQRAQRQVAKEMKGLEQGTDAYIKKSQQLNQINKRLQDVKGDINKVGNEWKKQQTLFERAKAQMVGTFAGLGLAAVAQEAMQLGKQFAAFTKQLAKNRKEVRQLTGATGEYLDLVTAKVQSLADTFDKDFNEVLVAANNFAEMLNVDVASALEAMQEGFASGADINGEFLDSLKEYGPTFREIGFSAKQAVRFIDFSSERGIFSDKGPDLLKEVNLRLREMPKATEEALTGIGLSGEEIQRQLSDGSIKMFDAIQMVSRRLAELPPQSREVGTAIADIFGGPGEDAGLGVIKDLGTLDLAISDVEQSTLDLIAANEALNKAYNSLFADGGGLQKAETGWTKLWASIVQGTADFMNAEASGWEKFWRVGWGGWRGVVEQGKAERENLEKWSALRNKQVAAMEKQKEVEEELAAIRAKATQDQRDLATQRATGAGLDVKAIELEQETAHFEMMTLTFEEFEKRKAALAEKYAALRQTITDEEFRKNLDNAYDAFSQFSSIFSDISSRQDEETKKGIESQRRWANASILLSQSVAMAKAIEGATASAAGTGPAAILTLAPFIASMLGAVLAAFGGIRANNKQAKASIEAMEEDTSGRGRYYGGRTPSTSIGFGDRNGPYTGYTHADEYVLSKAHRQDPVVASTESYVESTRRYGQAGAAAAGTAPLSVNAKASLDAAQFQEGVMMFREAVSVLQQIRIKAEFSGKAFEDADEYVQEKQNNRNRGRISGS